MARRSKSGQCRVFFAADIHGSERCFRKWLNAAQVYEADVLIFGGDIAGKVLVPIVANSLGTGYNVAMHGRSVAHRRGPGSDGRGFAALRDAG